MRRSTASDDPPAPRVDPVTDIEILQAGGMRLEQAVVAGPAEPDGRPATSRRAHPGPRARVVARFREHEGGPRRVVGGSVSNADADVVEGAAHGQLPVRGAVLPHVIERAGRRAPVGIAAVADVLAPAVGWDAEEGAQERTEISARRLVAQ